VLSGSCLVLIYPFPLGEEHVGALIRESHLSASCEGSVAWAVTQTVSPAWKLGPDADGVMTYPPRKGVCRPVTRSNSAIAPTLQVAELLGFAASSISPPHHDELLFIIVHQTYELWFKELLHDLDAVVANLQQASANPQSRDQVYEAARLLRRCNRNHTSTGGAVHHPRDYVATHFLAFRDKLEPASGFQSEQFRELEFLCGLKDAKMLAYHKPTPEAIARERVANSCSSDASSSGAGSFPSR